MQSDIELDKVDDNNALDFFKRFPAQEVWRFFVNGLRQKELQGGINSFFDNEDDYFTGIFQAANFAFTHFEKQLDINYIRDLRAAASEGVICSKEDAPKMRGEGFGDMVSFSGVKLATIDGLTEYLNKIEKMETPNSIQSKGFEGMIFINTNTFAENKKKFGCESKSNKEFAQAILEYSKPLLLTTDNSNLKIEDSVNQAIERYHDEILNAQTEDERLKVIVELVQSLEQIHPFKDANCRTFVMLLMNRLLMQNEFYPAILDDPNYFDAHSAAELIQEVKAGMQRTKDIINGQMKLYGVSTEEALQVLSSTRRENFLAASTGVPDLLQDGVKNLQKYFQEEHEMKSEATHFKM